MYGTVRVLSGEFLLAHITLNMVCDFIIINVQMLTPEFCFGTICADLNLGVLLSKLIT